MTKCRVSTARSSYSTSSNLSTKSWWVLLHPSLLLFILWLLRLGDLFETPRVYFVRLLFFPASAWRHSKFVSVEASVMARSRKSGLWSLLFFSFKLYCSPFFDVVVVVVVSEGRGADDPRRVLSGEIDRNNDIFVFFFFRLGIAKKAKGNNAPTKEFEARRVCVSYRHGIRMERKVYVSINLNDDRLVCRISSNLIFFSSLWFSRLRGERNRFFFFSVHLLSLSLSLRCALSNYKAQGFFFCLFMESTLFKMRLSSLVVGTLSTLSDEMKKGARTYIIISYRYIIFVFVFWGQYRPPRAVHCSTHTHTRAERTQWKWSGFVGHSTGILYQLLHTHTHVLTHTRDNLCCCCCCGHSAWRDR